MPKPERVGEPIEALLQEGRKFPPSKEFAKRAVVKTRSVYTEAKRNPLRFWERQAKELRWMKPWKKALDWKLPFAKWFVGGKLNASDNCSTVTSKGHGGTRLHSYGKESRAIVEC